MHYIEENKCALHLYKLCVGICECSRTFLQLFKTGQDESPNSYVSFHRRCGYLDFFTSKMPFLCGGKQNCSIGIIDVVNALKENNKLKYGVYTMRCRSQNDGLSCESGSKMEI